MGIRERLSGNEAVAYAMKQINPDVMGAYPITPSTEIPQYFSTYVDNGEVDTEFIAVESEHSAMSTCIGAEAAGCRAISATSSCGLCYMTEMLYVAASDRLPITLAVSCRALSRPHQHQQRPLRRHGRAGRRLADAVCGDEPGGLRQLPAGHADRARRWACPSWSARTASSPPTPSRTSSWWRRRRSRQFVGEYKPQHYLLNKDEPMAVGAYATPVYYMEAKRQQAQAMMDAKDVIRKVGTEFGEMTGRTYGLIETYHDGRRRGGHRHHRLLRRHRQGGHQRAAGPGQEGGPDQGPLLPSLPQRGYLRRP